MKKLSMKSFLYVPDMELGQYRIMNKVNKFKEQLENEPSLEALDNLVDLFSLMTRVLKNKELLHYMYTAYDSREEGQTYFFQEYTPTEVDLDRAYKLIEWAAPVFKELLEEYFGEKEQDLPPVKERVKAA